jgi:hypothetical protein
VQHCEEADAPRIAGAAFRFIHEYRHAAVDSLRKLGVAARAEDRAGSSVGVQELNIGRAQGEPTLAVAKV